MILDMNEVNSRYQAEKKDKTIKINIDLSTLNTLCKYVLQPSSFVRMEHLVNLKKLITILDGSQYVNDPDKMSRLRFMNKALEARLEYNLNDRDIILEFVNGGLDFDIDFLDYDHLELGRKEIEWLHQFITETLQFQFIYNNVDTMQELCTRFKTSDYRNRGSIVQEMEALVGKLQTGFRKLKVSNSSIEMTFSLKPGMFENAITDTYNIVTSPSRRLMCGMQGLNELLGGGFESSRVYMLLGTAGVGKSITLLNLMIQLKKYNSGYRPKDPSKTPCIVMLTQENSVVETITRLFDLVIDNSKGMGNYDLEEVINMLRTQGELNITDGSPIDIVIKYKANRSVNTTYLYSLYDDLDDEGYEVICMIQDHVKRIRSVEQESDLRIELGNIVNEFKVFANEKEIPVITVSHLNREAARIIEDCERKKNQDVGKLLGKSSTGESLLMIDNLDCGINITRDYDSEGRPYMTFNRVKMRDKGSERSYIAQPFMPDSTIRLVEDIGTIPQFKESLHSAPELNNAATGNGVVRMSSSSMLTNSIASVIEDDDFLNNSFSNNNYDLDPNMEIEKTVICPITFVEPTSKNSIADKLSSLKNARMSNEDKQKIIPFTFDPALIKEV
jgi:hypothetical protein